MKQNKPVWWVGGKALGRGRGLKGRATPSVRSRGPQMQLRPEDEGGCWLRAGAGLKRKAQKVGMTKVTAVGSSGCSCRQGGPKNAKVLPKTMSGSLWEGVSEVHILDTLPVMALVFENHRWGLDSPRLVTPHPPLPRALSLSQSQSLCYMPSCIVAHHLTLPQRSFVG